MDQLNLFGINEGLVFPGKLLEYDPDFLDKNESSSLIQTLITEVPWQQRIVSMYGKEILTPRLTAWYGDQGKTYAFTGTKFDPLPWRDELTELKEKIEKRTGLSFNSVLLNYYRDGNDSVAWHSDDETELGSNPHIASLSIGQRRKFEFRHKKDHHKKHALDLEDGSLLIMKGDLQHQWEHRIPKSSIHGRPRINLTFRSIL